MSIREYSIVASALNIAFILWSLSVLVSAMTSNTHGGYIFSGSTKFFINHTRLRAKAIVLVWLFCSFLIICNILPMLNSLFCLMLTYYFFIFLRYDSISRGFGAPGYFLTFMNLISFGLQVIQKYQPSNLDLILSLIGFEIGTIFFVSGLYKCTAGYWHGAGINIGLNNPMWGYRPKYWHLWTPTKIRTKLINWVSIFGEVIGGALLMSVKYQFVGALIISLMFIGVMFMVRLATLCPMIIFVTLSTSVISNDTGEKFRDTISPTHFAFIAITIQFIIFLTYIGISINFYLKKSLPNFLQNAVNFTQGVLGISLWRVFTSDITSIYIRIFHINSCGEREELSKWQSKGNRRFNFVGEAISVTSIFTLLRYQSSTEAFVSRLISYARTLSQGTIEFEYYHISMSEASVLIRHVRTYIVNTSAATVDENQVDPRFDPSAPEPYSRVSAAKQYGHYN